MPQALNVKEQIKQINILYIAMLGGQLILALTLFVIADAEQASETGSATTVDSSFTMIAALISVIAISLSFFLYNKRKAEGIQLKGDLETKLTHFRASFIIRAALIEGANLAAILFYFLEANAFYLILFAIGIGVFLFIRPSISKIIEDYQLSGTEQSELLAASN